MLGKEGVRQAAQACHAKAEYLKSKLDFVKVLNDGPTFNEFVVQLPRTAESVVAMMLEKGFLAGIPLQSLGRGGPNELLIAVTEKRTRAELDGFVDALREVCHD